MHSGDLTELGTVNLTEVEREALIQVMQRAKVGGDVNEYRDEGVVVRVTCSALFSCLFHCINRAVIVVVRLR